MDRCVYIFVKVVLTRVEFQGFDCVVKLYLTLTYWIRIIILFKVIDIQSFNIYKRIPNTYVLELHNIYLIARLNLRAVMLWMYCYNLAIVLLCVWFYWICKY